MVRSFSWILVFALTCFAALQANVRMGIISSSRYCGEREVGWRIKIAAERLGWTVFLDEDEGRELRRIRDLDWVISLLPENKHTKSGCYNYQTLFHPFFYLDEERRLLPFYEKYDGYLLTINDRESLAKSFEEQGKPFDHIPFYPSIQAVPYQKVALNNLVTSIPVWGNRLKDEKFKRLYKTLSKTDHVKFYGTYKNKKIIRKGYIGTVPFDGVSVITLLQEHGIVLVLHSEIHNQEHIPSSRIFEASAASTVIISDDNPFVRKHFGDSVFYIDTSRSAEEIFADIQAHLDTIFQDPERAWEMAKRAHEIFMNNFEMSLQLQNLQALHESIKSRHIRASQSFLERLVEDLDALLLEGT